MRSSALHILFVCTGNICRSPVAERLAVAYAARLNMSGFTASSVGTRAVTGHAIHSESARVLQDLGGDSSNFAARQITPRIASDADLILTMEQSHRDTVMDLAPRQFRRAFTLIEAARLITAYNAQAIEDLAVLRAQLGHEAVDIVDPMGRSAEFHAKVGRQIAALLPPILELCQRPSPRTAN
ncbi:low molecular weight phosphatase family protein [Mycolicibacterium elephantis]